MDNRVWVKDAVMTIRLPEEVDHFVADRLREEAGEILVERNVREVVFDFRKTVFMDSSGIGLVIGGKVRAVHVGERMRRILVMSGVTRVIEVEEEKTWK
jgi:stage II sporulation protein AA (anti-sigma F factor antagonist)